MKTVPPPSHVTAEIGRSTRIDIEVTNTADEIDGYTAIVDGINPSWVRLERPLVTVFPENTDRIVIHLDIPDHCQAGDYLIDVRVISAIDPYREASQDFWLTVPPQPAFEIEVHPSVITAGGRAATQVNVVNTGNCDVSVGLTAVEPSREVTCELSTPRMTVPYKSSVDSLLEMRGKRPWFGQPVARTIDIAGRSDAMVADQVLRLNQKARIPRGVITVLTLLLIIALWATIFLLAVDFIRGGTDSAKIAADEVDEGRENIPLDLIRGTVSGTVVGGADRDGIPAVTVTAFRVADVPVNPLFPSSVPAQRLESVASGGTGDDGTYRLRTLIPGDYLLYFSATGYNDVWYPGEFGSVDPLQIERLDPLDVPDILMIGRLGSVSATIELPPNTDVDTLEATIVSRDTPIQGFRAAPRAGIDGATCSIALDNPDNVSDPTPTATVTCTGVPTPGEYLLEITGDGFETQRIEVALVGGDDTVVDTAQLTGEPSEITGIVQDAEGRRLAGATVTVSSGQFEARVFSDSGGRYLIDDLPTPADYVVDISLSGYVGQTSALELLPASTSTVNATLVAGIGSIQGTVVGVIDEGGSPEPLGAVDVIVSGDRASARTATLTDGARGSFRIEGLAVPGTYTVTFRAAGYLTETRIVQFDLARFQPLGTVEMSRAIGSVSGTVIDPRGTPVVGAEVELTNGVDVRTTATTAPSGSFAFEGVAPGIYSIVVRATDESGDIAAYSVLREVDAGGSVTLDDLTVPLAAFGRVSGTVTDPDGNPLANVFVVLGQPGADRTTSSDRLGVYAFDDVDVPGSYEVEFVLDDHELVDGNGAPMPSQLVTLTGDGIATIDAVLKPIAGPVTGTVRAIAEVSLRLENAEIGFFAADGSLVASDATASDGRFFISTLAPGAYTVEARWCDAIEFASPWILELTVPAGGYDFEQDAQSQNDLIRLTTNVFDADPGIKAQQTADNCPPPVGPSGTLPPTTTTTSTTTTSTTTSTTSTTTTSVP